MNAPLVAVMVYLAAQFAIGVWVSRRIRTEADYLVAGRSLGYRLATFSIFATWFGAETIVGSGGNAYAGGVSLASAEPFGYALCLFVAGLVFAAPIWRRRLVTLADLYRERWSPLVERVAAVVLIPSSVLWAAAQVRAFAHVLAATGADVDPELAILAAAACTILYTMFGGLLTDAITDLVQGVVLVLGLVALLVGVMLHLGGPGATVAALAASDRVRLLPAEGVSPLALLEEWAIPVCGSVVATEIVSRMIAARSAVVARRSTLLAGGLYLAVGVIPLIVGVLGARLVAPMADAEQVVPTAARTLLPTVLYALFAGGLISAILSTVDSTLLVASGLLSHNLVVPLTGVTSERTKVRIARIGVIGFGLVAYVLAQRATGVFALVEEASAFGSAGVLVTVTFALFSRFGGPWTALATLVSGVVSYVGATAAGVTAPFLTSLAISLTVYLTGGLIEPGSRAPAEGRTPGPAPPLQG